MFKYCFLIVVRWEWRYPVMTEVVLIFADSRGKGLCEAIKSDPKLEPFNITQVIDHCIDGADVERLKHKLMSETRWQKSASSDNGITVIFSAGICSFTTKERTRGKQEVSCTTCNPEDRVQAIQNSFSDVWRICKESNYRLIVTNIYPVDLAKSSKHFKSIGKLEHHTRTTQETGRQQRRLESDIRSLRIDIMYIDVCICVT